MADSQQTDPNTSFLGNLKQEAYSLTGDVPQQQPQEPRSPSTDPEALWQSMGGQLNQGRTQPTDNPEELWRSMGGSSATPSAPVNQPPSSGPYSDFYYTHAPEGSVLNTIGQGAKQLWGNVKEQLTPWTPEELKQMGIKTEEEQARQQQKDQATKSFGEAFLRPATTDLVNNWGRVLSSIPNAFSAGYKQLAEELKPGAEDQIGIGPGIDQNLQLAKALLWDYPGTVLGAIGAPAGEIAKTAISERHPEARQALGESVSNVIAFAAAEHPIMSQMLNPAFISPGMINKARAEGAIGEPEGNFTGKTLPTESALRARQEAVDGLPQDQGTEGAIHINARQWAPEAFSAWDQLQANHEVYTQRLQDAYDTAKPEGRKELPNSLVEDTPEITKAREDVAENYKLMQELSPTIKEAYGHADEQINGPRAEAEPRFWAEPEFEHPASNEPFTADAHYGTVAQQLAIFDNTVSEARNKALADSAAHISTDVSQKLVAAGRPQDEADSAGKIVGAYYNRLADRLQGKQGSGKDLYDRFAPDIQGVDKIAKGAKGSLTTPTSVDWTSAEFHNLLKLAKTADPSTFIHEFAGHQWLEDLLQFSQRDEATDEFKGDAKTVRDWLGIEDGKGPSRTQHERFAKAAERYFMEGHAPSKDLADVFEKFKQWILQIYQNLKSKGAELNPDIRAVFDRMLAEPDKEPVIAPEEDRAVPQKDPIQITDSNDSPTPTQRNEKGSKASKTQQSVGEGQELYQSNYISKDGKPLIKNLNSDEDVQKYIEDVWRTNNGFAKAKKGPVTDSQIIDLAGALGTTPKKIQANLNKLSKMGREDKIPLAARIYALQKALEQSATDVLQAAQNDDPLGYADASLRHLNISQTFFSIRAEWGRAGHAFQVMGEQAKEAEGLSEYLQSSIGKSLDTVKRELQEMKNMKTVDQVSGQLQKTKNDSIGSMLLEYTIMNYISGPFTHMTYAVGNKLFALYKAVPETAAQAGVSAIRSAITGKPKEVFFREVPVGVKRDITAHAEQVRGIISDLHGWFTGSQNGLSALGATFATGDIQRLGNEGSLFEKARNKVISELAINPVSGVGEGTDKFNSLVQAKYEKYVRATAQKQASYEGLEGQEFRDRVQHLIANYDDSQTVTPNARSVWTPTKAIPNQLGKMPLRVGLIANKLGYGDVNTHLGDAVRFFGEHMVTPIHASDRIVGFEVNRAQMIMRQALKEGLTGEALQNRVASLTKNTPNEILSAALAEANEQALLGKGGGLSSKLSALVNYPFELVGLGDTPLLRFVQAFTSIGSQIIQQTVIERSILGPLVVRRLRDDILGRNGPLQQDKTIGKIGLGTAVWGAAIGWYNEGILTPGQPYSESNPHQQVVSQAVYGLPHSLVLGHMSYEVDRMGAPGRMLAWGADIGKFIHLLHAEGKTGAAADFAYAAMLDNTEEVYQGFGDIGRATQNEQSRQQFVNNFVSSALMPYSSFMSQTARFIDPLQRNTHRDLMETLQSKIPWASEELADKIDLFGNPVPAKEWEMVTYGKKLSDDPVWKAFETSGYFPAPVRTEINGVPLNESQQREYAVLAGQQAKRFLDITVSDPDFASRPAVYRHKMLSEDITAARQIAQTKIKLTPDQNNLLRKSIQLKAGVANSD